jgi:hypothetical protein
MTTYSMDVNFQYFMAYSHTFCLLCRFIFGKSFRSIQTVCKLYSSTYSCEFTCNHWVTCFHPILESLGDCSFLNTCFHMDTCKVSFLSENYSLWYKRWVKIYSWEKYSFIFQYVHYEVDYTGVAKDKKTEDKDKVRAWGSYLILRIVAKNLSSFPCRVRWQCPHQVEISR